MIQLELILLGFAILLLWPVFRALFDLISGWQGTALLLLILVSLLVRQVNRIHTFLQGA